MTNHESPASPETGGWRAAFGVVGKVVLALTFVTLIREVFFPKSAAKNDSALSQTGNKSGGGRWKNRPRPKYDDGGPPPDKSGYVWKGW